MPIEFELKRARQMIKDLKPEIERNMRRIAEEEVQVARLSARVDKADEKLAGDRADIMRMKKDLDSGSEFFVYAGRTYSERAVKTDLANRFAQFKTESGTADQNRKILSARQAQLTAAREKLNSMLDARRQLQLDVEHLQARLTMVEVHQTTSDFKFDDSKLSRTQELIGEISTRIEVAEKLVQSDVQIDRIPLDETEVERGHLR